MGRGLTDKLIASLEPPATGRRTRADDHPDAPPGFGVRITARGVRSFFLRYRLSGRDRWFTIARWGCGENGYNVAQAREDARILRQQIEAGVDPVTVYPMLLSARAQEMTVENAATLYLNALRSRSVRTRDPVYFRERILPAIGKIRLTDVTDVQILLLLDRVRRGGHRVVARRVLAALQAFLSWAEDLDFCVNPITPDTYRVFRGSPLAEVRDRVLSDAEIREFWRNIDSCGVHRGVARALKLVLVTGQRPTEVVGMEWSDVDHRSRIWRIPAAKRGNARSAHTVPLSDLALQILKDAERGPPRQGRGGRYVFATSRSRPLARKRLSVVNDYREKLGNLGSTYWLPSDLRRTCRERLKALGGDSGTVAAVMGRARLAVDGSNIHPQCLRAMRDALQRWALELQRIAADCPIESGQRRHRRR